MAKVYESGEKVKRFYYTAFRKGQECEGIVRADSLDSAKEKLLREGYEEVTLSMLSSFAADLDAQGSEGANSVERPS